MSNLAIFNDQQEVSTDLKAWIDGNKSIAEPTTGRASMIFTLKSKTETVEAVIVSSLDRILLDSRFDRLTKTCIDNSVRLTSLEHIEDPTSPLESLITRLAPYLTHRLGKSSDDHEPLYDALWRIENRIRKIEKALWCHPNNNRATVEQQMIQLTQSESELLSQLSFTELRTAYEIAKSAWRCDSINGHAKTALRNLVRLGFAKSSPRGYLRCK